MADSLENLKKLNKDQLIEQAIKKINDTTFHIENYDRISVLLSEKEIVVSFEMSIQYVPAGKEFCYNIRVSLVNGSINTSINENRQGKKPNSDISYYNPREEDKQSIDFIIRAINRSKKVGHIPKGIISRGNTMIIYDRLHYFDIRVNSKHQGSFYKIDKETAKIYDLGHKHYTALPRPGHWEEIL